MTGVQTCGSSDLKAIRKARPHAKQVADRFHLVKNCGKHMVNALKHNMQTIKQEIGRYTNSPPASQAESLYAPPSLEEIELFNKVKAYVVPLAGTAHNVTDDCP